MIKIQHMLPIIDILLNKLIFNEKKNILFFFNPGSLCKQWLGYSSKPRLKRFSAQKCSLNLKEREYNTKCVILSL